MPELECFLMHPLRPDYRLKHISSALCSRRSQPAKRASVNKSHITWMSKPPKPPTWQDFLQKKGEPSLDFTDLTQVIKGGEAASDPGSGSGGVGGSSSGGSRSRSKHRHHRYHHHPHKKSSRHKLHRTRSEFSINESDIPEESFTLSLAETKPRQLGLHTSTGFDSRLYLDENKRRCESWLAGVKASQPLDDIDFMQGAGVQLEIPEENWEDLERIHFNKPGKNAYASGQDSSDIGKSYNNYSTHGKSQTCSSHVFHSLPTDITPHNLGNPMNSALREEAAHIDTSSVSCQPSTSRDRDGRLAVIHDVAMETDNENEDDFNHHHIPGVVIHNSSQV